VIVKPESKDKNDCMLRLPAEGFPRYFWYVFKLLSFFKKKIIFEKLYNKFFKKS